MIEFKNKIGSKAFMTEIMDAVFEECRKLRGAGQAEYAHRDENAFANFERVAERVGWPREAVLMVFAEKHLDGIHSYIKGHRSQRESIKGRIDDVIVYMCLLRGMVEQDEVSRLPEKVAAEQRVAQVDVAVGRRDPIVRCQHGFKVGDWCPHASCDGTAKAVDESKEALGG